MEDERGGHLCVERVPEGYFIRTIAKAKATFIVLCADLPVREAHAPALHGKHLG